MGGGRLCHMHDMMTQGSHVQFLGRSITLAMIVESAECTRCSPTPRKHCVSRVVKTQTVLPCSGALPSVEFRQRIMTLIVQYARALAGFLELRATVGHG